MKNNKHNKKCKGVIKQLKIAKIAQTN